MNNYTIIKLSDKPELREKAASYFHSVWKNPLDAYLDSIDSCLSQKAAVPQWYVVMKESHIIAGLGVIENDFHMRTDLTPNICAVYVEEKYRNRGIAKKMLQFVCDDMQKLGFPILYLITDHASFYEKCGWDFLCMSQCTDAPQMSRVYVHKN